MTITLSPEIQEKLIARAVSEGQEPNALVSIIMDAYLNDRLAAVVPPSIEVIDDEDTALLNVAVAVGDEDFTAKRYQSLEELRTKKQARFGLAL